MAKPRSARTRSVTANPLNLRLRFRNAAKRRLRFSQCVRTAVVALAVLGGIQPGLALELTGVLLHAAGPNGELAGPVWHTASGYGGRPLGFTRWPPPGTRGIPFPLAPDGRLAGPDGRPGLILWPVSNVAHLFWQFRPGEFPAALVLNLYFNGDTTTPGISALVFDRYGFTHFVPNPAPSTLSLYLDLAPNPASTEYTDGTAFARLTAAFFFSSSPSMPDRQQWRPSDFVNLDRVGVDRIGPDALPDGILIFQLDVLPASAGSGAPTRRPWSPPSQGLPEARSAGTIAETAPAFGPNPAPAPSRAGANTPVARDKSAPSEEPSPGKSPPATAESPETVGTPSPEEGTPAQTPEKEPTTQESRPTTARPRTTPTPKAPTRAATVGTTTPAPRGTDPPKSDTPASTISADDLHDVPHLPAAAVAPGNPIQ